jgi:hypothetical protein
MSTSGRNRYDYAAGVRKYFTDFEFIPELCYAPRFLEAMDEPALAISGRTEVYRFLWLRTFHYPIVVRLELGNNRKRLVAKVLDGMGGYDPGILKRTIERNLADEESNSIIRKLAVSEVWRHPVTDLHMGLDGSYWILEGIRPTDHLVVSHWSPTARPDTAAFYQVCRFLIRLADLSSDGEPVY